MTAAAPIVGACADLDAAAAKCGAPSDEVIIIQSQPGVSLCKQYDATADGWVSRDKAHAYKVRPHSRVAHSIFGLAALIERAATNPRFCIIRGAPVLPGPRGAWWRRHYHDNLDAMCRATGDVGFVAPDPGRRWVLLDIDKVPMPEGFPDKPDERNVRALVHWIRRTYLPKPFARTTCYWRWSASAGVRPWRDGASIHLWFWLDRAVTGRSLAAYLKKHAPRVDTAPVASYVQPHYIAPPMFSGAPAPALPGGRSGIHVEAGIDAQWVRVPDEVLDLPGLEAKIRAEEERAKRWREDLPPAARARRTNARVQAGLRGACDDIMGAGVGQRHDTLKDAAYRFARKVAAGELDEREVVSSLTSAARAVLPKKRWKEIDRTIRVCMDNGMKRPRPTGPPA